MWKCPPYRLESKSSAPEKTMMWDTGKIHTEIITEALGADTLEIECFREKGLENRFGMLLIVSALGYPQAFQTTKAGTLLAIHNCHTDLNRSLRIRGIWELYGLSHKISPSGDMLLGTASLRGITPHTLLAGTAKDIHPTFYFGEVLDLQQYFVCWVLSRQMWQCSSGGISSLPG